MAVNLEKELTHKPLKEEIYDALHRQIIAGKYSPATGCARMTSPPRWA